jgi:hypothetical protein
VQLATHGTGTAITGEGCLLPFATLIFVNERYFNA